MKLTDLYMAVTCILEEQYTSRAGFALSPGDVVLDIGGHIGSFAVYAAQRAARVIVYEPDASSHAQLLKNLAANGLINVTARQEAVAGRSGSRPIYPARLNSAENNFYWGGPRGTAVSCVTLEEAFRAHGLERCDFLKIDCEGAEYEILRAAPADVLARVRRIGIEAHVGRFFGIDDPSAVPATLLDLLRRAGFETEHWVENDLHTFIWARRA
ncbi:MAG: FkbM family methyltransferase [Elusimicrobia bacterium]|nr:FkbM family methyltransferase [Elusimicrobiota bacterium]